jgi:hypothetical protein
MTHDPYRDSYRGPQDTSPPWYSRDTHSGLLWATAALAVAAVVGLGFWATSDHSTANPPAVTAAPAPATGTPAPPPEQTTGQPAPRAR